MRRAFCIIIETHFTCETFLLICFVVLSYSLAWTVFPFVDRWERMALVASLSNSRIVTHSIGE